MVDGELRARTARLLRGEFRSDDLTRLLLYARDRCDGRESVQEIGDFVAHHNERTKGLVTRTVRDWFHIAQFFALRFAPGNSRPVNWDRLPANTPQFLEAAMRRINHSQLRKKFGAGHAQARRILPRACNALTRNADGTYRGPQSLTSPEAKLVQCLSSYMTVVPAFTGERFYTDFLATLRSHGLVKKEESAAFAELKIPICMYAATVMHKCNIRIDDDTTLQLSASHDRHKQALAVHAVVPMPQENLSRLSLASSIFSTIVDPAEHFHRDLLNMSNWDVGLEVTSDKRLCPLR